MKPINWKKLFSKHKGKWVALKDDEKTVIASGEKAKDVHKVAVSQGVKMPIMLKVPMPLEFWETKDFSTNLM